MEGFLSGIDVLAMKGLSTPDLLNTGSCDAGVANARKRRPQNNNDRF